MTVSLKKRNSFFIDLIGKNPCHFRNRPFTIYFHFVRIVSVNDNEYQLYIDIHMKTIIIINMSSLGENIYE